MKNYKSFYGKYPDNSVFFAFINSEKDIMVYESKYEYDQDGHMTYSEEEVNRLASDIEEMKDRLDDDNVIIVIEDHYLDE